MRPEQEKDGFQNERVRGSRVMIKWHQEEAIPGQRDRQLPQVFSGQKGSHKQGKA